MPTFYEAASSSAFVVAHPSYDDIFALVSGDYVTFGWAVYGTTGVVGLDLDATGPWPHGLGTDGIRGVDAASLYETVMQMIDEYVNETGRWAAEEEEE